MKKLILLLAVMLGTSMVYAENYSYLTFETTDGMRVSVPASSLDITISGATLTAGSQSFTLSNLQKMYFSNSDETTSIQMLTTDEWNEVVDIYDLNGRKITQDNVTPGVYVVMTKNGTHKIVMK